MYMDDFKVYEESRARLEDTMETIEEVSGAVGMVLGLRKYAVAHVKAGRVERGGSMGLRTGREIPEGDTYRYLGVTQLQTPAREKSEPKRSTSDECHRHGARDSIAVGREQQPAHNAWCTAVCRYCFGAIRWEHTDMTRMDQATRKILQKQKCHHMNAAVERL